jgi:4-amino-4-deoxy-L-arabinose transferase-like glycosyltransferase
MVFIRTSHFTDDAYFGGDIWEYQSMAVNFAKGHGIQKFGELEPFETYKFEKMDPLPEYYSTFKENPGWSDFYRTPVYPLFLGSVYKIFGISPLIAKKIQLILLIIVAASLPWIGKYFWKLSGFVSGLIACPVFLNSNYLFSQQILTEALCVFALFLVVISYIFFDKKRSIISCILLGISLGFILLVKGTFIFIPFLLGLYLIFRVIKTKSSSLLKQTLVIVFSSVITVLPWSVYASKKSGTIIFVSSQGKTVLLDYNNEYNLDGHWHPEYRKDVNSFYNKDGINADKTLKKVLNFYTKNSKMFIPILINKFKSGFSTFIFLTLFLITLILVKTESLFRKINLEKYLPVYYCLTIPFIISLLICEINIPPDQFRISNLLFYNDYIFFAFLSLIFLSLFIKSSFVFIIPDILIIIFISFLLITLVIGVDDAAYVNGRVFYYSRFVKIMDFIFILVGIHYLREYLAHIKLNISLE